MDFDIYFGSGIDTYGCMLDAAEGCGVLQRKGSFYYRGDFRIAQGKAQAIDFLKENVKFMEEISASVSEVMKADREGPDPSSVAPDSRSDLETDDGEEAFENSNDTEEPVA